MYGNQDELKYEFTLGSPYQLNHVMLSNGQELS